MKINQHHWTRERGWEIIREGNLLSPTIVFVFGSTSVLENSSLLQEARNLYPDTQFVFSSTAGEILDTQVFDESLVLTAVELEKGRARAVQVNLDDIPSRKEAGQYIFSELDAEDLRLVLVLSDGRNVNGSQLVQGFNEITRRNVPITGGLAGDGSRFEKTLLGLDDRVGEGNIIGVGFYGEDLKVGYGSAGGWEPFGVARVITRSEGQLLHELDNQSALGLYKKFLGEHANKLPGSALRFPLLLADDGSWESGQVRTILNVDETKQTMTFAGDMPEGTRVRFMNANFDRLLDGAHLAASGSLSKIGSSGAELAFLVSCVGRKLVLGQRTEEEVEEVRSALGPETALTGFYSYGEISPGENSAECRLHNQTMTITTLSEQ